MPKNNVFSISSRSNLLYKIYAKRINRQIDRDKIPHHIAVIVDGNRRWAKMRLMESAAHGHKAGAKKIPEFLGWCEKHGVDVVTLYLLSADNLKGRDQKELNELYQIIADLALELASGGAWNIHHVGNLEILPKSLLDSLHQASKISKNSKGLHVNLAIGYGGRSEIAAAVRSIISKHELSGGTLSELADILTPELIGEHLYTKGQADPDLVIRTSGEQRLSDFMLWQSAHSEFYFVETLYPDLHEVDFLRALRDFSNRSRRFGS